jgi:sugar phosphate isomerase/epimerase
MKTIKGPAIFLAQFMGDTPPFNTLEGICKWAADLGYKAVQIPTWEPRLIDLKTASESKTYCDELKGRISQFGLEISELSTHLQGQLVAVHPAYDSLFDAFAPKELHGNPAARTEWAVQQLHYAAQATRHLGLDVHATFSGALIWPYFYPWPQRPKGLAETGFSELAARWVPILDKFDAAGVDLCFEIHAGEDLHDGVTFERFLAATGEHPRVNILFDPSHYVLQQIDYLQFIDIYHEFIRMFHVKDAEFIRNGRTGAYGGYLDWSERAGRFRSPGDGQVDFKGIFSRLSQNDYDGWAVMEWECCIKSPEQGAREGAAFIRRHIIEVTEKTFDDFAGNHSDEGLNRRLLGL